jgi:hypothetical protein
MLYIYNLPKGASSSFNRYIFNLAKASFYVAMKKDWKNLEPQHHHHFVKELIAKPRVHVGPLVIL